MGHRAAFFSLTKISFDFKCLLFKEIEVTIAISNVNVWVGLSTCICRKRVCQDQLLCLLSNGDKIPCEVSLQLKSKSLSLLSFCEVNLREGGGRCVERSGVRRMHPNLPSSFLFLFHLTESASKL